MQNHLRERWHRRLGRKRSHVDAAWLVNAGIPANSIIVDTEGNDTWATAQHASNWMRKHRLSSAMVVTQYFHVPRTMLALKRFGVSEVNGAYPPFLEGRDAYSIVREAPAFLWYAVRPFP
ncbi:hypothetical protein LMG29739_04276 [Paraburkholderia solisilvae]|uniref:DUF218 domain-containing protein n=1 Tax=Paraburkholderia solisilvae TaxID=624376 RepID=A0A6J5ECI1_9BURK|nr:YdcF family protein [Paraburkholderia solisilvae]CAB3764208.1 hypothetical protein LMG29739_04276 [Paraburkholderia solisilvae]